MRLTNYTGFFFLLLTQLLTQHAKAVSIPNIETVTITANRSTEKSLTNAITHINNSSATHSQHISEVLRQSPGTWISRGNGQEHLTAIRSPVLVGSSGCAPFLMSEDNIPLRAATFCNVNQLFDSQYEQADHIEVLHGPGTVFHGSNAMHGVINIISPDFENQPLTTVSAEFENSHDYKRLMLDHRDTAWMIQALTANDNGFKHSSGFDQQKLRLKMYHGKDHAHWTHSINIMNLEQETASFINGKDAYKNDDLKAANHNPEAFRDARSFRAHSEFRYKPEDDSELLLTPYIRANQMDFLMHFIPGNPLEKNGHYSLGLQSSFARPWRSHTRLTTGFDIDFSQGYLKQSQQQTSFAPFPVGDHYDYEVDVYTVAMFIQSSTDFTDRFNMTLGTRLEDTRYDYDNRLSDGTACTTANAATCRYIRPADNKLHVYHWSPKVAFSFLFNDDHHTFIALKQAYRAPQTSELFRLEQGQNIANIDAEGIRSAEIGFHGQWSRHFKYSANVFSMKKHNVIFKDSNRQNVDNQKTRHQGIELAFDVSITPNLWLTLASSYAKHTYDSNIQLFTSQLNTIKGNIIDTAPRHIHSTTIHWQLLAGSKVEIESHYLGEYYLDPDNSFSYPGHTLSHIRFEQSFANDWQFSIGIINAANIDYAERADITVAGTRQERYFIGEPRSVKLSISKAFTP